MHQNDLSHRNFSLPGSTGKEPMADSMETGDGGDYATVYWPGTGIYALISTEHTNIPEYLDLLLKLITSSQENNTLN